jgi:hypothetical protein
LFGSTKRKFDLTLGSEYDSHRSNNLVNNSIPHPNTRSTRAHIDEFLTHDKNVVSHQRVGVKVSKILMAHF